MEHFSNTLMGVELAAVTLEEVKRVCEGEQAKTRKRNWREDEDKERQGRVDGRAESKVGKTGRALDKACGDGFGDRRAKTAAKAEKVKVVNRETIRLD